MLRLTAILLLSLAWQAGASTKNIDSALEAGLDWLVEHQNPDGSWGSAGRTKNLNIFAPGAEAHPTLRLATTSLAIMALHDCAPESSAQTKALSQAREYLMRHMHKAKRTGLNTSWVVNNWAHCYALRALIRLHKHKSSSNSDKEKIAVLIKNQLERLNRYQYPGGGWGYYDFDNHTQQPGGKATSFLTASVLIALREVRDAGFDIDEKIIQAALRKLRFLRKPDNSFLYSYQRPGLEMWGLNRKNGSLARSQACNLALILWRDSKTNEGVIDEWLTRIISGSGWLESAIKQPEPHAGYNGIASYFFYYGYFYASTSLPIISDSTKRAQHADGLAKIILRNQDANGCWFDFPFYDYGQAYGTSYAVMSLKACRDALAKASVTPTEK